MGRSLALVLAAVLLVAGLALIDRDREPERGAGAFATAPPVAEDEAAPAAADTLGDTSYLFSCLSGVTPRADVPAPPPLTPAGVAEISHRVERLRELRYDGPVDAAFLTDAQLDRRISRLIDTDYPPSLARRQARALELLGAIPPGSDLLELTRTALSSQVLGLFVPETQELLVAKSDEGGALEQITLAHELEHALAYDALGFPLPERTRSGRGDRDLAAQALVEGDATLTMELYALRNVSLEDQLALADDPAAVGGDAELAELPHLLQRQLVFPYDAGLRFVCSRYERGGWKAVDRAYDAPPSSTAELLDPEAGPIRPVEPPRPGSLPEPWRRTLSDQIGAAELSWLFEAPGDDPEAALPDPASAAADWRGGGFQLWQDGSRAALAVTLAQRPGGDLCGASVAWYGAAYPEAELSAGDGGSLFTAPDRAASIVCDAGEVRIGIGPDEATALRLTG